MSLYAEATSRAQGEELRFRLLDGGGGPIRVEDVPSGRVVLEDVAAAGSAWWTLTVGEDWPSSLYRAVYHEISAYFVVRSAVPASPILVSIPFPTWEAYNRPGVPGEGLYQSEQPDRAVKVTFDRPGAGPQIEEWELGLLRWLGPAGYTVDYCSGLDLHGGLDLLARYRLLVINGHDEYWSWEMRDAAEEFARRGGNIAIFSGNTCWWQVRFEDDLRTMACYRDAVADPVAATDPGRVTVEWPSDPVNRPENTLTGLSFRNGAGCWVDSRVMARESYTVRFAGHWVFEGTGLADGDTFGRGAIGYETDAADLEWIDGVPRATGRDGTPPSFVVLATADLAHWRRYGKGGAATMGIHRLGAGTIVNTGTINWGNTLKSDPVLARITRNVLDRLSQPPGPPAWDLIGEAPAQALASGAAATSGWATSSGWATATDRATATDWSWSAAQDTSPSPGSATASAARPESGAVSISVTVSTSTSTSTEASVSAWGAVSVFAGAGPPVVCALVCCENRLFAACSDGTLTTRDVCGQNLPWRAIGPADAIALAAPREAHGGPPAGLYGVAPDGTIRYRAPVPARAPWEDVSRAPDGTIGLAAVDEGLFAITSANELWHLPIRRLDAPGWACVGPASGATSLTAMNGRLFAISSGRVLTRPAARHAADWTDLGPAGDRTALAAAGGRLIAAGPHGGLYWRPLS